ncbi:MAG: hypothetical protein SVV80_14370 [Planctomycetota bacterium]|nr:hypothetical protein [Planctomycetota bacterium]
MTRLQKSALFDISLAIISTFVVVVIFQRTGSVLALVGIVLVAISGLCARLFRGKEQPNWDEREIRTIRLAALMGYLCFWMLFGTAVGFCFRFFARDAAVMVPTWLFILVPLVGVNVLVISRSLATLWLEWQPLPSRLLMIGFCVLMVLLGASLFAGGAWLLRTTAPEIFAGSYQGDEWHITTDTGILAHSRINLTHWPENTRRIPITLPYEDAKVQSAAFGGKPVEFHQLEGGNCSIALPDKFAAPFDTTVDVRWTAPLAALEDKSHPELGTHRARLASLIPVSSRSLKIVLDLDCGYEITDAGIPSPDGRRWTYLFRRMRGDGIQSRSHGSCWPSIRKAGTGE